MSDPFKYQGQELVLFEKAINWKKYFSGLIQPYVTGRVIECGVGIGSTCKVLNDGSAKEWILLEPDKEMADLLRNKISRNELPSNCKVIEGTISSLENKSRFDTILYIDVLEHIENDKEEIEMAAFCLNAGGHLIVLSPAFQFLYSKFDNAIGHYRRYNRKKLKSLLPASLKLRSLRYLDSFGFFLSFTNKFLLKQKYPTKKQVHFWDRYIIPLSKMSDNIFNYSFGKSILGIWQKNQQ
jgi:2-polyprenyl-3-methyl-5-hydroxy-6-metoxy-1,4-benzoquinol methylase